MREIHRILYIRTDRMGDLLMNLPALRLLRQTFPKAWITLMADRSVSDLVTGQPDIDEVWAVDAAGLKKSWRMRFALIRAIKKARFDLAVVANPSKFFHVAAGLAGIRHRVGYARKWGFFLTRRLPRQGQARHEIDRNLALAALVSDKNWDGKLSLPSDGAAAAAVEKRILDEFGPGARLAVVHAGTSHPKKRWPAERFAEVCGRLAARGTRVVLIGGPEERAVSQHLRSLISRPVADWTGTLSLKELASFFRHPAVSVLISADSGPVHVAWMSGVPVVALYARDVAGSDPARWGPRDAKSQAIFKPMSDITADEVMAAVDRLS